MKRGFTLLELMVVIIILGVLATLGVMQYQAAIEKSRGAEARQVLGQLRSMCAAVYMQDNSGMQCTTGTLNIGTNSTQIPSACRGTHFFSYGTAPAGTGTVLTATRCTGSGKSPDAPIAGTLTLTINYSTGSDSWTTTGGY